ncbi:hypothetical protein M413DRAFT_7872 [Hebeloma cylindrosporum]|uniref:Uncharacterized protein n=1 Tax=Hebeloma cylindrosporum TaxID=76867 RepID=A0A0C3CNV0_HEBCY|nr:hypothetical protein M413DRAFT_7872 [Hebeloma cylindrosporum h7]
MDWEELKSVLIEELLEMEMPRELNSKEELIDALDKLEAAITRTIEKVMPRKKPSPYAKRWWTKELEMVRKKIRRIGRQARHYKCYPDHSAHGEWKKVRNELSDLLCKTKHDHYIDWIESINAKTIWDTHKFSTTPVTDGAKTRIPALKKMNADGQQVEVHNNEGKNIKGAFPNTVPEVLAHDMRRSEPIPVNNRLGQGCNLAMYGYRFFNAFQIEGSIGKRDELATNFADDAACATSAKTLEEAAERMRTLFQCAGGPAT